jgi:hypothetical protein
MQVGDLIQFKPNRGLYHRQGVLGLVVDGPRQGYLLGMEPCDRFKVAWLDAGGFDGTKRLAANQPSWHTDDNLEVISSCK